jgi:4-hydroxybenzoate polyprenyltransferase
MRFALLFVRMLRYRVATMIWLFMLLGAASRAGLDGLSWRHLAAAAALAATYVAATTQNDVADREIDLVNHPRDRGRPLVSGEATVGDLWLVHAIASAAALGLGLALGTSAFALVALSLVVSWAYSLRPLRLSYRTYLAHPALGVAYVAIPYGLGLEAVQTSPRPGDALFGAALFFLFLARIVLKDFRDREGDARFGKPTLLLRFGKRATCAVSLISLVAGNVLLLAWLRPTVPAGALLELLVAGVLAMLFALLRAEEEHAEQVAIGLGARLGNGLLISVLAWLALAAGGAAVSERTVVVAVLVAAFGVGFMTLVTRPEQAVIGYKG